MQSRLIRHTALLTSLVMPGLLLEGCAGGSGETKATHTTAVAFSPDGGTIAAGSWTEEEYEGADETSVTENHGALTLFDGQTGEVKRRIKTGNEVWSIAFSPDGTTLAIGSGDGRVRFRDAQTLNLLRTLPQQARQVQAVAFARDGSQLASAGAAGGNDNTFRIWDVKTGAPLHTFAIGFEWPSSVAFSPDGRSLAAGSGHRVRMWDAASGTSLRELTGHTQSINAVAFARDGQTVASGSWDRTVRLWDVQTGQTKQSLAHREPVQSVAFFPSSDLIATGSRDGAVRLWDSRTGALLRTLSGSSGAVTSIAVSPDGRWVASGHGRRGVRLWDAQTGELKWSRR